MWRGLENAIACVLLDAASCRTCKSNRLDLTNCCLVGLATGQQVGQQTEFDLLSSSQPVTQFYKTIPLLEKNAKTQSECCRVSEQAITVGLLAGMCVLAVRDPPSAHVTQTMTRPLTLLSLQLMVMLR
jgi:hypothetical protein